MWRMAYFPNISKFACLEQNLGPYLKFPILIYTFLLLTLIRPKTFGQGCKFLKISMIFLLKKDEHEKPYENCYKDLVKKWRMALFIRRICGERKNTLGHRCSKRKVNTLTYIPNVNIYVSLVPYKAIYVSVLHIKKIVW